MRALYFDGDIDDLIRVEGEKLHHFKNVLRLKLNEKVLLLDGLGGRYYASVKVISKKEIILSVDCNRVEFNKNFYRSIVLGKVKKEALDLCLKSCVELGYDELFIIQSEYSQSYDLNLKRVDSIIVNSMEQSNNPYKLKLSEITICQLPTKVYQNGFLGSNHHCDNIKKLDNKLKNFSIFIGPEGGFSKTEQEELLSNGVCPIKLGTSILRTPTALCAMTGYLEALIELKN